MLNTMSKEQLCPVSSIDPFSDENLLNPYPMHEALRALGPVVFLEKYDAHCVTGFEEGNAVLSNWETYCSSAGIGYADFRKEKPWRTPSPLLEVDPPLHTRNRTALNRIISPAAIRKLKDSAEADAEKLVSRLVEKRFFDGVTEFAEVYPLKVFGNAVGLPTEGRENLVPYGALVFNAFGPPNARLKNALEEGAPLVDWVMSKCHREALAPGGFGMEIFEAADRGEIAEEEAPLLVRSVLAAGIDSTVNSLATTLCCFAQNPEEWDAARENPALIRGAFEESLRFESPVQTIFRTTVREVELAGTTIPEGQKVVVFLGAANRDPNRWAEPARFNIRRPAAAHIVFGSGIHVCLGQIFARLEAVSLFTALSKRVAQIKLAGEPIRRLNNTNRGLANLPVEVVPA